MLNKTSNIPKQIRKWTCHKLECFADYIVTHAKNRDNNECYYLELYAGCGQCTCKGTDCLIDDSPLRALKANFDGVPAILDFIVDPEDCPQSFKDFHREIWGIE